MKKNFDDDIPTIDKPPKAKKKSNKYARKKPEIDTEAISIFESELERINGMLGSIDNSEDRANIAIQLQLIKSLISMLTKAELAYVKWPSMQNAISFTNLANSVREAFTEIRRIKGNNAEHIISLFDSVFEMVIDAVLNEQVVTFKKISENKNIGQATLSRIEKASNRSKEDLAKQLTQIRKHAVQRIEDLFKEM